MNGVRKPKFALIQLWHWQACFSFLLQVGLFSIVYCKCHFFCACVRVCFCEHLCLACLSVILRHRWGSSQPVSFIIPTNYSKSSFQSSCSTRSSLSPFSPPSSYVSIHPSHLCSLYLFRSPIWVYQSLPYSSFLPYLHEIGDCDKENWISNFP